MNRHNYVAVDLGNSFYKAIVSTNGEMTEYSMPNAIALFDEEFYEKPYDDEDVLFGDNLIVEVNSSALHEKREIFYIGKSAARQRNVSLTSFNNQKVDEDRTYTLLFGLLAHHAVMSNQSDIDVFFDIDQLAVSLPTTQYKERKDTLKSRLIGTHTVYLHKVPGMIAPQETVVRLHIKDVIVGAEGACAYLALTRDEETLGVKDEALLQDSAKGILIGDLGGDSVDFVGIKNNKPVASIEGEPFGINQFLDHIIQKVSKYELYKFDSRSELEEKIVAGQSEWYVEPFAGVKKDISKYIIPQLKSLAIKYLEHFDRVRNSSNEIKGAVKYIAVGGAAKIAESHIREAAVKWAERGRPIELFFPPNMEKLNVSGLMILAKLNQLKNNPAQIEYTKTKG
ncbi:ParM/StbA family protein [Rossellomorea aquimaris]|uniref:ParM/StbA family protein n=1 Tax=Rossellomorea aquimaris TaxID=189382 RepID=UPI001CD6FCE5|nr:ParM/StbA family protein [Rossellomorea aquimaris]MCA1059065.1 ParM/StbA family protein [Rossellomorea aquimaris]